MQPAKLFCTTSFNHCHVFLGISRNRCDKQKKMCAQMVSGCEDTATDAMTQMASFFFCFHDKKSREKLYSQVLCLQTLSRVLGALYLSLNLGACVVTKFFCYVTVPAPDFTAQTVCGVSKPSILQSMVYRGG